jgi:hypothetical protein
MAKLTVQTQTLIDIEKHGSRVFHDDKGRLHHETGPAVHNPYGEYAWYYHGLLHRIGGPACKDNSGFELWAEHGQPHRTCGPAKTYHTGAQEWYVRGLRMTALEFDLYIDQDNGDILIPPGKKMSYRMEYSCRLF